MVKYVSTKIEDSEGNVQNPAIIEKQEEISTHIRNALDYNPENDISLAVIGNLSSGEQYYAEYDPPTDKQVQVYIDFVVAASYAGVAEVVLQYEDNSGNVVETFAYTAVDANNNEMNAYVPIHIKRYVGGTGSSGQTYRIRLYVDTHASANYFTRAIMRIVEVIQ